MREELNKGIVPADIDIHALAGLIKVSKSHDMSLEYIRTIFSRCLASEFLL